MLTYLRWGAGAVLMIFGVFVAFTSWVNMRRNWLNQRDGIDRHISGIPLIGSSSFLLGWLVAPMSWSWWSLLFLAVDIDTPILIIGLPWIFISQKDEDR